LDGEWDGQKESKRRILFATIISHKCGLIRGNEGVTGEMNVYARRYDSITINDAKMEICMESCMLDDTLKGCPTCGTGVDVSVFIFTMTDVPLAVIKH
jgi:hypothetical protein